VQGSDALLGDGGLLPTMVGHAHGAQMLECQTLAVRAAGEGARPQNCDCRKHPGKGSGECACLVCIVFLFDKHVYAQSFPPTVFEKVKSIYPEGWIGSID
jgi:hypothetical protein